MCWFPVYNATYHGHLFLKCLKFTLTSIINFIYFPWFPFRCFMKFGYTYSFWENSTYITRITKTMLLAHCCIHCLFHISLYINWPLWVRYTLSWHSKDRKILEHVCYIYKGRRLTLWISSQCVISIAWIKCLSKYFEKCYCCLLYTSRCV